MRQKSRDEMRLPVICSNWWSNWEESKKNMSDNQTSNVLCDGCGEAFSNFLQEMADQNAKVATCPKCGKIHAFPPPKAAVKRPALRKTS
ncbi:MAG: hypothetical protein ABSG02_07555 [Terriglobales bacterium]|jgi:hypothetical protein